MKTDAVISACGQYRYVLRREWDERGLPITFVMLNPSTADDTQDDPTIRRCIGFAQRWGYGSLIVVNLFAYRATSPAAMRRAADPIGPENDRAIQEAAEQSASSVVAAWGAHGAFRGRDHEVLALLGAARCLGTTKGGFPRHPLYLAADTPWDWYHGAGH